MTSAPERENCNMSALKHDRTDAPRVPEALHLRNQLCFPLYACARELVKSYKPHLERLGLTYTQYITMMVLWEVESVTAKELGQRLYLDSGTLTPLLKRMEAKGLIHRQRDPVDERSLRVTITEEGRRLKERALEIPYIMAECFPLSEEDAQTLYHLLYAILEHS